MVVSINNLEDIKELIALTECGKVEFKETTGQLDRGMETLCAFLNGEGGTVIENPGMFPNDWDMDKMKSEHCSVPRNPLIANVLYKRKLLENWGRGISLMMEECKKANLPEPEYKMSGGFVILVFRYGENNRISTTQVPHKHRISTTQVLSLINIVEYNTYSVKEMMDLLDLKSRSYFSKDYLKPAVEAGLLEPIFPEQLRSPKQKYRLTEKGKALLSEKS